jgi:Phosphatidylglycerophosphate synthase
MKTYEQFRAALPTTKKKSDTLLAKLFLRDLSMPVAWGMYRMGFSGNGASLLAILLGTVAMPALAVGGEIGGVLGIVLLSLVALLDCVDGNIARAAGVSGPKGEWIDAVAGYAVYALLPIAVGVRAGLNGSTLDGVPVLLGAIAVSLNIFTRLAHQKYETAMLKASPGGGSNIRSSGSLTGFISGELGLCGIMIPGLAVCVWLHQELWFVAFYAVVYVGVASAFFGTKLLGVFRD